MKFIHTSDWHLGKRLKGFSLWEFQEKILKQLAEKTEEIRPEVFIIAGDIYDTSAPRKEILDAFTNFLKQIKPYVQHILVIPGNHDNQAIVGQYNSLLEITGIHIFKNINPDFNEIEINGVCFYPIPYLPSSRLEQFLQEKKLLSEERLSDTELYKILLKEIFNRKKQTLKIPILHLGVSDNKLHYENEEERGTVPILPVDILENFAYTALGHYHKFLVYKNKIVYPSSLLQYRETENNKKGFVLGTIENQNVSYEFIPFELPVEIVKLSGKLDNTRNLTLETRPENFENKQILGYFEIENLLEGTDVKAIVQEKYPFIRIMEIKSAEQKSFAGKYEVTNISEFNLKKELSEFVKMRSNPEDKEALQERLLKIFKETEL